MANVNQFGAAQNYGFPQVPQIAQVAQPQKKQGFLSKFFNFGKNYTLGTPESFQQVPTQSLQGMQALQQLLSGGMQGLEDPYAGFDPIAQQAREQFNTETVPSIAERFTALGGSGGSQSSSAFQGALGSAGSGLERQLAAMKSQYGLQNREGLLNQLKLGLTPQFDTVHHGRQPGLLEKTPELITKVLQAMYAGK